jgi:isoquinoline 1-oxidoreductase
MNSSTPNWPRNEDEESAGATGTDWGVTRRTFIQAIGAGLVFTVTEQASWGQRRRGDGGERVVTRLQLNLDGTFTALSGKVEEGQGARSQLSAAAAEELRVNIGQVHLLMADTDHVPDDGITAGSRTTPQNVPPMRQAAATARELLTRRAAEMWQVAPRELVVRDGAITQEGTTRRLTYAELAGDEEIRNAFRQPVEADLALTVASDWRVMGQANPRPNCRDLVTGAHRYPSDIVCPNMLYGRVLRAPAYRATLESIDLSAVEKAADVVTVREGDFVGVAAPTLFRASAALELLAATAKWKTVAQPSSENVHAFLKEHAQSDRSRPATRGSVEQGLAEAAQTLRATYTLAYIQHAPMEPRAAVAEWTDNKLTVWTGCDGPYRAKSDLMRQFNISADQVRVVIPDMGGGFGGKHSPDAALEAARLAKAAGKPVCVRWTRAEEFTWAYFRPAAVIECIGALTGSGALLAWDFTNINAGGAAIDTPYDVPHVRVVSAGSDSPLNQGAYRCLAATGNHFARESFMDELAAAAGQDPLAFRLAHLKDERIRTVLETAATNFRWEERRKRVSPRLGVGLACGTEKGSVVAACVEVALDPEREQMKVTEVCEAFECGAIQNPGNLTSQVQGCIMMGLGGALFEEMLFADGQILNASFARYRVPHFEDVPRIEVHLVNRPAAVSVGGGETPIVAIAPAVGNAIFAATGRRVRAMPMQRHVFQPS